MNKGIRTCTFALAVTTLLGVPAIQAATLDNDSGFYVGGAYGGYTSSGGDFDDDQDLGEFIAGYRFNDVFAIQGNYIDFGKFGENAVNAELTGVGIALIGRLPVSDRFGIYAKGGAFQPELDVEVLGENETYDEAGPFVGLGADYRMSETFTLFAEYNRYNVDADEDDFGDTFDEDEADFDTAQVGLKYQF